MTEKDLLALHKRIALGVTRGATRWLQSTVNALKRAAPVASGQTRSSIRGALTGAYPRFDLRVEAPTAQASFTERGTKPHGINPRKKRALRWQTRGGTVMIGRVTPGRWMVTRAGRGGVRRWLLPAGRVFAVNHPGTVPRPWIRPTVAREALRLGPSIASAIGELVRRL